MMHDLLDIKFDKIVEERRIGSALSIIIIFHNFNRGVLTRMLIYWIKSVLIL